MYVNSNRSRSAVEYLRNWSGTFFVTPKKLAAEIPTLQAAKILGIHRQSLIRAINEEPLAQKHIRWRWLNPVKKGKRLFEVSSLYPYMESLRG